MFHKRGAQHLRAVSKAWRNDIAHLVDTYTEEDAKGLLNVIPLFLRHLAEKMDENGTLFRFTPHEA